MASRAAARLASSSSRAFSTRLTRSWANLEELEAAAKPLLSAAAYDYYASGSDSQVTMADNRAAFARWRLLPRILQDVSQVDTSTRLLGRDVASPVLVAPMAMQRLCHPDGELAMARGAAAVGVPYILSTMATTSLEELAAEPYVVDRWFQLYVLTQREITEALVRDAEALGYTALVVTVDAPRLGKREADERNRLTLPPQLSLKNLERITKAAGQTEQERADGSKFGRHFSNLIDGGLTWDFIPWLKSKTHLPVIVKGILAPDDARRAVELGADGVIVSNHGGRQLDYTPAAIDVLQPVVDAVAGRAPVLVDGGIRRGTDVLKCLCMGASAVLVGRPLLYALTLNGQQGVENALELLRSEFELGMALLGCQDVSELGREYLIPPPGGPLQLPASRL